MRCALKQKSQSRQMYSSTKHENNIKLLACFTTTNKEFTKMCKNKKEEWWKCCNIYNIQQKRKRSIERTSKDCLKKSVISLCRWRVYKESSCTNRPGHVQTWVDSDYAHVGTFQAIWPKLRHLCGICMSPIRQVQVLEGALNRHSGLYLARSIT
jgi:hypothetical protein